MLWWTTRWSVDSVPATSETTEEEWAVTKDGCGCPRSMDLTREAMGQQDAVADNDIPTHDVEQDLV